MAGFLIAEPPMQPPRLRIWGPAMLVVLGSRVTSPVEVDSLPASYGDRAVKSLACSLLRSDV